MLRAVGAAKLKGERKTALQNETGFHQGQGDRECCEALAVLLQVLQDGRRLV